MKYSTNEFKSGLKILLDGDPYSIVSNEFVKPGKGQAFNRVKIRNLKNGRTIEKTFKSGESVEGADVIEVEMQYLYGDGEEFIFMNPSTFEQISASKAAVEDAILWIKEQDICTMVIWNDIPLSVETPQFVELTVTKCDPGVKGNTVSGGSKPATLETGAEVQVPLFIEEGEVLKINTQTASYESRVKN